MVSRRGGTGAPGQSLGHVRRAGRGRRADARVVRGTCRAGVRGRGSGRGGPSEAVRYGELNLPTKLRTEPGQAELWHGPGRWEGPETARPPGSQLGGMGPLCLGRLPGSSASRGTDPSLASPSSDPQCLWSGASALPVWDVLGPGGLVGCRRGVEFKDYFMKRWCLSCNWEDFRRKCEEEREKSIPGRGPAVLMPASQALGGGSLW